MKNNIQIGDTVRIVRCSIGKHEGLIGTVIVKTVWSSNCLVSLLFEGECDAREVELVRKARVARKPGRPKGSKNKVSEQVICTNPCCQPKVPQIPEKLTRWVWTFNNKVLTSDMDEVKLKINELIEVSKYCVEELEAIKK